MLLVIIFAIVLGKENCLSVFIGLILKIQAVSGRMCIVVIHVCKSQYSH